MGLLNRSIPWLSALSVFLLFERVFKIPEQVFYLVPLSLVIVILCTWQLTGRKIINEKFWRFSITPVFFLSGAALFLTFFEGLILRQIFLVVFAVFIWVYFEVLFLWLHHRPRYQAHSLENISTHLDLLTIFFLASGSYSLIAFLGVSIWILAFCFIMMSGLLTYQLIWTSGANVRVAWTFVAVITLVISEIFFAVTYLPSSIYVNGLIVTLCYYLMTGLARNWLIDVKEGKVIKRYLLISIIAFLLVMISAKWF